MNKVSVEISKLPLFCSETEFGHAVHHQEWIDVNRTEKLATLASVDLESGYYAVMFGFAEPELIFASRPSATKVLYESGHLLEWLAVLVPSGPGFSCV